MCSCSSGIETTIHFFLHCANYNTQRQTLFDKIITIDANILSENENNIVIYCLVYCLVFVCFILCQCSFS